MTSKLAINGGTPVINTHKKLINNIVTDNEDIFSVVRCFENNAFSKFRAGSYEGGPEVIGFEEHIRKSLLVKHAVSFDTWSNGIIASLMSMGITGGDEVLVTPYTMTSCATSILSCGAIPVFVDIDKNNLCISPDDIRRKISKRTKAIFVVHLAGIPADMKKILNIASEHNLYVFEDCAQAPLAKYCGLYCGTMGDVGGFSLTESKHVMSGEGGIAITNNDKINNGLRVVRNHGEVCNTLSRNDEYSSDVISDSGLIGHNFRMTEITSALAKSQWKKLEDNLFSRRKNVDAVYDAISNNKKYSKILKIFRPEYNHIPSWYFLPFRFDENNARVSRKVFVNAINAEGLNFNCGYVDPLYNQSIYTTRKHWVIKYFAGHIDYAKMMCRNVEDLQNNELILTLDIKPSDSANDIVEVLTKIIDNIDEL